MKSFTVTAVLLTSAVALAPAAEPGTRPAGEADGQTGAPAEMLLIEASATQPAGEAGQPELPSEGSFSDPARQTWEASVSAPPQEARAMDELDDALADLERLIEESARARAVAQAKAAAATQPTSQPASTQPAGTVPAEAVPSPVKAATTAPVQRVALSKEMLKRLRDMTKRRRHKMSESDMTTVIALGDTLFQAGQMDEASMFYDMALDDPNRSDDHAWSLFQAANCRRKTDPEAAIGLYRRLIAEHPDTPWSHAAQMQQRLLEWRQMNRPEQAVQEAMASIGKTAPEPSPATPPAEASISSGPTTQSTQITKND